MSATFDNRNGYIWYNGEFVDWPEVKLKIPKFENIASRFIGF